ncbi:acetate--CoA ligase family protein [Candidatus Peregrinibacteria bacterium]|nr:acetate--CoA ligase family protein [Candidatus Peregrinibacteria bacterium]
MGLLRPTSIAVLGASATPGKVGHEIFKNLITQGFRGSVFAVNKKGEEVLGKKAYASVMEIKGSVDLAVIVTPAATVADLLEQCATKKIKYVIVISAGFGETHTEEGSALEARVKEIANKEGITLIGPNCLGMLRPSLSMNASFAKALPPRGSIALVSQSGAMAVALMDGAAEYGLGFSLVTSIGNKTVTDESDFLEFCDEDPETAVIGLYLESIRDGRKFLHTASTIEKPIVLLKSGASSAGKKAAASHTGALAGSDAAIDAVCNQAGIRRAKSTEEFLDLLQALESAPPLLSDKIAVITNAGGPGILASDAAEKAGLTLPSLTEKNAQALKKILPPAASIANPIDVLGDAGADRFAAALDACGKDKNIDGVVVLLTPQVMTPSKEIAFLIADAQRRFPLMPIAAAFMGGESVKDAKTALRDHGIPSYETPERAVRAIAALRAMPKQILHPPAPSSKGGRGEALQKDMQFPSSTGGGARGGGIMTEEDIAKLFHTYHLPLPKQAIAATPAEAINIAETIGYPVIAKISSPQILHKTDIGAVRGNLKTKDEVAKAFEEIMKNAKTHAPNADTRGMLIQQFLPVGHEFIIGMIRDAAFGPLVMVGLGGIYTELFRDTTFRIAPFDASEAYEMLQELSGWKLLLGMRGEKQAAIDKLAQVIVSMSQLAMDHPEIVELDLNPVFVSDKGIVIADAKVITDDKV